jgi:hypothetical protein
MRLATIDLDGRPAAAVMLADGSAVPLDAAAGRAAGVAEDHPALAGSLAALIAAGPDGLGGRRGGGRGGGDGRGAGGRGGRGAPSGASAPAGEERVLRRAQLRRAHRGGRAGAERQRSA